MTAPAVGGLSRMYGETSHSTLVRSTSFGLSPHVRGNPTADHDGARGWRSIPACTGKPKHYAVVTDARGVYPRMYGETEAVLRSRSLRSGLSPHVRGNPRLLG